MLLHLQANPQATSPLLAYETERPAVISLDPKQDVRRVLGKPSAAAAEMYKPIQDYLGTKKFFR